MKFLDPDGVSYLWNAVKSRLAKKSDTGHTHSDSTITSLDASKLTGTIDLARLPQGSLEHLVKVTDQSARFKLTSREVQLGDTVQQLDTGTMYIVVDEAQLSSEKGYTPYTAASATAVPWSGITGKPETYPPASHSHSDYALTSHTHSNYSLTSHTHNYAGSSSAGGAANSAVKATQDSAGQQIDATYIKGLSVNGKVITYTKGDGNTGTITTQDTNTTYSAATQSAAGLMSAADKKKLDGIASGAGVTGVKGSAESAYRTGQVNLTAANVGAAASSHTHSDYAAASHTHSDYAPVSHTHSNYAASSHTHNYAGSSSAGGAANSAVKATQDSAGQQIDATYIKGLSVNGKVITYTKGDGNTGTITTQDTNTTYSAATQSAAGLMSAADKKKLDGIASGAGAGVTGVKGSAESAYRTGQVNLTAANVGAAASSHTHSDYAAASHTHSNYAASSHTHNYAGSSSAGGAANSAVKATQDSAGQQINTTYIKGLSVSGKVITYTKGDGKTGTITTQDTNTTYSAATQSAAGLMSAADKTKLDGVASGANKYTLPTASGSTLGGVKTTSTVTSTSGLTACPIISGVPYYKDTNTTYSLSSFGVTATAAELNKMDGITATTAELNYCDGVTSNIQTQLNGKAASSHSHDYYNSIFIVSSSQPSVQTGKIWLKPV